MDIPITGIVIMVWNEVFFKIRVYFDGLLSRMKVFWEYSQRINTYIDVIVEVIEAQSSVSIYFCIEEEFIEFW